MEASAQCQFCCRREVQGSTLNFEVLGRSGAVIGYKEVGEELSEAGFHLRTGCTCNPGACYNATGDGRAWWEVLGG